MKSRSCWGVERWWECVATYGRNNLAPDNIWPRNISAKVDITMRICIIPPWEAEASVELGASGSVLPHMEERIWRQIISFGTDNWS